MGPLQEGLRSEGKSWGDIERVLLARAAGRLEAAG